MDDGQGRKEHFGGRLAEDRELLVPVSALQEQAVNVHTLLLSKGMSVSAQGEEEEEEEKIKTFFFLKSISVWSCSGHTKLRESWKLQMGFYVN